MFGFNTGAVLGGGEQKDGGGGGKGGTNKKERRPSSQGFMTLEMASVGATSFTNPTLDPATANSAPHINVEMTTTNHDDSSSKIPDDWDAHETEHGDTFYVQRGTGLTQWDKPSSSSSPHHHTRDSTRLPPNWNKYNDKEGRRYYSNNSTQESAWVAPEGSTGGSAGGTGTGL